MPCRVSGMQENGGVTVGEYPQWSCLYSGTLSLCGWVGSHDGTPRGRPALCQLCPGPFPRVLDDREGGREAGGTSQAMLWLLPLV